ncbi:MAG TPA: hypothetical protein PKO06_04790 [Candidatus Ozemobacteraceae bacterium]|nr:hypothetical protein [Candidatus Ozemobacteraceae bacterium]
MIRLTRRGIALPIVFGVILCLAVWIGSLSWTMSQSRFRFTQSLKYRRAYFMARSALQHFFLKVKVMQRRNPEVMNTLYQAKPEKWPALAQTFVEDITQPMESPGAYESSYRVASFSIDVQDTTKGEMVIQILAEGDVSSARESIRRVYKVTR